MNNIFLEKAGNIDIKLHEKIVNPKSVCSIVEDEAFYNGYGVKEIEPYSGRNILLNGSLCFDFGEHYVGYLSFKLSGIDEVCDSPVKLKFTFAEVPFEFSHKDGDEPGWLSYSWIQEETIFVDILPAEVTLPRRYAFRYVKVEILAKNKRMRLIFDDIKIKAVSAAGFDYKRVVKEDRFAKIDEVSQRTLRDCMQTVYEDGPKRDRRLWLGDIRLQALVNYSTVKDINLVKKCLYLFAGLCDDKGCVPSCLYEWPKPMSGEIYLCDYSLVFMAALWDYYEFSGDKELCEELFDVAYHQFELFYQIVTEEGTVMDQEGWWCFIDWDDDIPKPLAMAAIAAYCMHFARDMAAALGKTTQSEEAEKYRKLLCHGALKYFNSTKGLFEENGIVSWNVNAFWILAGAVSQDEGKRIMKKLKENSEARLPVTPYVYHYIMESYGVLGMKEEMENLLSDYWGEMISSGADTFWEAFKKGDSKFSPYDDCVLNSACHAWSCTPIYLIKKYLEG